MHPARLPLAWLLLVASHAALDPPAHHLHHYPRRTNDQTRPSQNWRCERPGMQVMTSIQTAPRVRRALVRWGLAVAVRPAHTPRSPCLQPVWIDRRLRFGAGRCRGFKRVQDTPSYLHADVQGVQGEKFVYVPMRKAGSSYITEVGGQTVLEPYALAHTCVDPILNSMHVHNTGLSTDARGDTRAQVLKRHYGAYTCMTRHGEGPYKLSDRHGRQVTPTVLLSTVASSH